MTDLSGEELKQLVRSTIQLSELLKDKRKEMKRIRDTYKAVCDRIKAHASSNNVSYIDMAGYQLRVYSQAREPALNEAFLKDNLQEFFTSSGHNANSSVASDAATYVMQRKKAKIGGKQNLVLALKKVKVDAGKTAATLVLDDSNILPEKNITRTPPAKKSKQTQNEHVATVAAMGVNL